MSLSSLYRHTLSRTDTIITDNKAFYWGTSEWTSRTLPDLGEAPTLGQCSADPADEIQQATEIARRLNMVGPVAEQAHYSMLHRERFETEYAPLWKWENYGRWVP